MSKRDKLPQSRRNEIKDAVLAVMERSRIGELPVELADILCAYGFACVTFDFAATHGITVDGTDDGFTVAYAMPQGYKYVIVYNSFQIHARIRWTIAHEIGHIILGHVNGSVLTGDLEAEANYFARELMAPLSVLDELGARTPAAISAVCDISKEASTLRAADFARRDVYKARYGNTRYDLRFLSQFSKMFDAEFSAELAI